MARPRRARRRLSPIQAVELLLTEIPYPFVIGLDHLAAAEWITEAVHNDDCHIWRDGKKVSKAEAAHLSILANFKFKHEDRDACSIWERDEGTWDVTVRDDRFDQPEEGYEFDADEIRRLLPETEAPERPAAAAMERRKPGKKTTAKWKLEAAIEMRDFVKQKGRKPTAPELCERIDNKLNYYPDESEMRKLMRLLLDE
jgi:hypothetical protein